jgi:hypothetical protein
VRLRAGGTRSTALAVAVLLGVGFVGSAPLGAASPAAATIVVTPSTGLVPGQVVTVSGSGFAPGAGLASAECKAGPVATADCDTGHAVFPAADSTGAYSFSFTVARTLFTANNSDIDCTASAGACVIAVAAATDLVGTAVTAPISFAPLAPPRQGDISVTPDRVQVGNVADVTATGFAPYAVLGIGVCAAGATVVGECVPSQPVDADASGGAQFALFPPPILRASGNPTDCSVDGACEYATWDARDFAATLATAPVRISPVVPGTLTVTPSSDLHDGDQVQLSGSGWPADTFLQLYTCDSQAAIGGACNNMHSVVTAADGTFSTAYTVHAVGDNYMYVNCETGPCWIAAISFPYSVAVVAAQPISFDVTPTPVTSHYTAAELAAVDGAATTLGISDAEVQHLGSWGLAWVLAYTHTGTITPAPDSGPGTLTTDWLPSEYAGMNAFAAAHGTTLAEFQKTGALFLAYVLAIS